jgi:2,3,4,5-tetrahydropyridine-2-carboxylate N-succinyltransferase
MSAPHSTSNSSRVALLREAVEGLRDTPSRDVIDDLLAALESAALRAAARNAGGTWEAVPWVKRGILAAFRLGVLTDLSPRDSTGEHVAPFTFIDKDTLPARAFTVDDGVRIVPGGSTIRRGSHVARGVVCMPPIFVNVGAFVDRDTLIDSHALVGSCAQIGARVHLSAGVQIGGVLEPVNASPVIIEDDVVVGGNCGVYEGVVVRERAVLGAGVILTRSMPVYDLVQGAVYRSTPTAALEIPAGAVVVSGTRPAGGEWGRDQGLAVTTAIIVKYRDAKTDAATVLESAIREKD